VTGIAKIVYQSMKSEPAEPYADRFLRLAQERAVGALDRFRDMVGQIGIPSWETRLIADEPATGVSMQGRYCDLLVLGQLEQSEAAAAIYSDFPEYVTLNCGCPVLIVPREGECKRVGENVVIAWNASLEAKRAVHGALPLLRRAKQVRVAVFNAASLPEAHGEEPGADIALYLARHGVNVEVIPQKADVDVGDALLWLSGTLGADLLVMGCYGHSRFREIILGGATRTVLQSMTIPVLMSH
jgi:nucleotide-binding universal stress UspA family protein